MLISTIVLIVIRLFGVNWFINGLSMLAIVFYEQQHGSFRLLILLPALLQILMAAVAWIIAPFLSLRIPGRQNVSVPISGLSLRDLYAFAFVFLGLYFALGSIADFLNWFHYSLLMSVGHDFDPERKASLYSFSRPLITFLGGLICVFCGPTWARKLSDNAAKSQ